MWGFGDFLKPRVDLLGEHLRGLRLIKCALSEIEKSGTLSIKVRAQSEKSRRAIAEKDLY